MMAPYKQMDIEKLESLQGAFSTNIPNGKYGLLGEVATLKDLLLSEEEGEIILYGLFGLTPMLILHLEKIGNVHDFHGRKVKYYEEVPSVLEYLKMEGFVLAVASRTGELDGANQLLKLFNWDKYFSLKEIYPGSKINHFKRFKAKTGFDFSEMLFFDDEYRNKVDLQKIGVCTVVVENGVTRKLVDTGLQEYSRYFGRNRLQ